MYTSFEGLTGIYASYVMGCILISALFQEKETRSRTLNSHNTRYGDEN